MALVRGLQRVNAACRPRTQLAAYNYSQYSTESNGPGTEIDNYQQCATALLFCPQLRFLWPCSNHTTTCHNHRLHALQSAVYVIFGASGGIGSALGKRLLAQPGSTVVLAGRDESRLQQLQQTLGGGVPMVGDPLDAKQVFTSTCNQLQCNMSAPAATAAA